MGISLATCKFPWGAHSQILPAMQSTCATGLQLTNLWKILIRFLANTCQVLK